MENFVSWIHALYLEKLDVHPDRHVLDIPQLSLFISRTELLSSLLFQTSTSFIMGCFSIKHHFKFLPSLHDVPYVNFNCVDMGKWQVSQVDHICTQLSLLASSVKQLKSSAFHLPPNLQCKTDPAPWLQLLMPYDDVEEIKFCAEGALSTGIAKALQQSTQETVQELLPVLRILRIRRFHSWSIHLIMSFVVTRQLAGRPVIMRRLKQMDQDTDWVINNTCENKPA